jgi:hypothetical protein
MVNATALLVANWLSRVQSVCMLSNRSMPRSMVLPELAYPDIGEAITRLSMRSGLLCAFESQIIARS